MVPMAQRGALHQCEHVLPSKSSSESRRPRQSSAARSIPALSRAHSFDGATGLLWAESRFWVRRTGALWAGLYRTALRTCTARQRKGPTGCVPAEPRDIPARLRAEVPEIVDDATTEAVAVVPARALGGLPLTRVLDTLAITRGLPQVLRTDNAPSSSVDARG